MRARKRRSVPRTREHLEAWIGDRRVLNRHLLACGSGSAAPASGGMCAALVTAQAMRDTGLQSSAYAVDARGARHSRAVDDGTCRTLTEVGDECTTL